MFKKLWLVGALGSASTALASHYDHCTFEADIVGLTNVHKLNATVVSSPDQRPTRAVAIRITAAEQHEGQGSCRSQVGTVAILEVTNEQADLLRQREVLKLDFQTMGGLTPKGFWGRYSWTLSE